LRFFANAKAIEPAATAPLITQNSTAFQSPVISRNARTTAGLTMPDPMSPKPNTTPASKDIKLSIFVLHPLTGSN
jgi:hypothetical protein